MGSTVEALEPNVPYRVRARLGPSITRLGRTLGEPEYHLRDTEYVDTVQQPLDAFTETLQKYGFEWNPLAWYHQLAVGTGPNGSWAYRRTLLADRQVHVILVANSPEYIDVFAHEEYSWLRHPIKHLRQVGIEREAGRSKMMQLIESHEIQVDVNPRRRRRVTNAAKNLCEYLGSIVR